MTSAHRGVPIMNSSEVSSEDSLLSNLKDCVQLPFDDSRILLVVSYSIVFAIGLPTNCLTAFLIFVQIRKKNILAVYLLGLLLCELLYLSTLPLWIIYVQNKHKWMMGSLACKLTGYIFFCNIYISILLLCCISIDRYIAVVKSLETRGVRGQKKAMVVTVIVFIAVLIVHCPVFTLDDGEQTQNRTTCFETLPLNSTLTSLNFARFIVGFAIPLIILIFTNYNIFQSTKTSSSLNNHQKAKVKYLAIAIITIFLICFAPYHLVLLIRSINFIWNQNDSCSFEQRVYTTSVVFLCLCTVNSIADPVIYVLISNNVRRDFYGSLRERRFQSSSTNDRADSVQLKNSKESQEAAQTTENSNTQ